MERPIRTTTFQIPFALLSKLRMMCIPTDVSMGEFIRIALRDKIKILQEKKDGTDNRNSDGRTT